MLKVIKDLYGSAEETYLEIENKILDHAEDAYDMSKDYINDTSEEITLFFNDYFMNAKRNIDDPVLVQLNKLNTTLSSIDETTNDEWDSTLIFVATSIGHMNEKITDVLCKYHHIMLEGRNTQARKINSLKEFLSKTIINDLHFINSFRNSILHHNDYGFNLSALDMITKRKLLSEANTALAKLEYVYNKLKDIQINKIQK